MSSTIRTIDTHYMGRALNTAAYLVVHNGVAAFVDNNTPKAVPHLMQALEAEGLSTDAVKYIIVTHVHMDHSAGTSALAKICGRAQVLAHPRAAPHLVNPEALVNGTKAVYGDEAYRRIYGGDADIQPIPEDRVIAIGDGETVRLSQHTELAFWHTRGHARHHMVVHDTATGAVMSGDSFGVSMWSLVHEAIAAASGRGAGAFSADSPFKPPSPSSDRHCLFPSSTPIDFELGEAHDAVEKIASLNPRGVYLSHFGRWNDVSDGASQLHATLEEYGALQRECEAELAGGTSPDDPLLTSHVADAMKGIFTRKLEERGFDASQVLPLYATDMQLNGDGILVAARRALKARSA